MSRAINILIDARKLLEAEDKLIYTTDVEAAARTIKLIAERLRGMAAAINELRDDLERIEFEIKALKEEEDGA